MLSASTTTVIDIDVADRSLIDCFNVSFHWIVEIDDELAANILMKDEADIKTEEDKKW